MCYVIVVYFFVSIDRVRFTDLHWSNSDSDFPDKERIGKEKKGKERRNEERNYCIENDHLT